jgi:hypothetical protein
MPQPRDRQQDQQPGNQQDQSPNNQGKNPPRQAQESHAPDKRSNPDRYPDQGKQAQKPSDTHYPEQDPSGKAERPDAVDGAESGRPDRGRNRDDVN